jgi:hypothetical protein
MPVAAMQFNGIEADLGCVAFMRPFRTAVPPNAPSKRHFSASEQGFSIPALYVRPNHHPPSLLASSTSTGFWPMMGGGTRRSVGVTTVQQCKRLLAIRSYFLTNDCSVDEIYEHESCCMLTFPSISCTSLIRGSSSQSNADREAC